MYLSCRRHTHACMDRHAGERTTQIPKLAIPISLYSIPEITSLPPPKIQKDDNKASADYLKVK